MAYMPDEALVSIFSFHPANTEEKRKLHEDIRENCLNLARYINSAAPDSPEKTLAIRHIQYAMMMANSAVAQS